MTRQAVLDTNVLISGVLWRGVPYRLLTWAEKSTLSFYSSLDIMTEVYRVLHYPKFQRCIDKHHTSPGELFEKIESLYNILENCLHPRATLFRTLKKLRELVRES